MTTLWVQNWDKWQSYRKDRGTPPWIKIHRNLMSNPDWAVLTDAEKGQLISIWVVAADKNGKISSDPRIIKKICQLDEEPNISKFIELDFLSTECQPPDNHVTTTCPQHDAPETDIETDIETDKKKIVKEKAPAKKKARAVQFPHTAVPQEWIESAREKPHFENLNLETEAEAFLNYHLSKGSRFVVWRRAWATWLGNAIKFSKGKGNGTQKTFASTPASRGLEALERVRRKDNETVVATDA